MSRKSRFALNLEKAQESQRKGRLQKIEGDTSDRGALGPPRRIPTTLEALLAEDTTRSSLSSPSSMSLVGDSYHSRTSPRSTTSSYSTPSISEVVKNAAERDRLEPFNRWKSDAEKASPFMKARYEKDTPITRAAKGDVMKMFDGRVRRAGEESPVLDSDYSLSPTTRKLFSKAADTRWRTPEDTLEGLSIGSRKSSAGLDLSPSGDSYSSLLPHSPSFGSFLGKMQSSSPYSRSPDSRFSLGEVSGIGSYDDDSGYSPGKFADTSPGKFADTSRSLSFTSPESRLSTGSPRSANPLSLSPRPKLKPNTRRKSTRRKSTRRKSTRRKYTKRRKMSKKRRSRKRR